MKLTSYQIREALKEGKYQEAACILAQHYGHTIDPPENKVRVSLLSHTGYAIRI